MAEHEAPSQTQEALDRFQDWSLDHLRTRYLPGLIDRHGLIPSMDGWPSCLFATAMWHRPA